MARPHPRDSKSPSTKAPVTMREIARLVGDIHPSTVSLALRNHRSISPGMRKRIHAIARKVGYHHDPLLDAFNARRVSTVQHRGHPVIPFVANFASQAEMIKSPRHAALWEGAARAADAMHYRLEFFPLGSGYLTARRLDSILLARGIDCFIAASLPADTLPAAGFWDRYCAVKIDGFDPDCPSYTIAADVRQGVRLAMKRAWDRGYRRIGLALVRSKAGVHNDLLRAGYLIEQRHRAASLGIPPLLLGNQPDGRAIRSWLRANRIDAVLSDYVPLDLMPSASQRLPGVDIAWAALDVTNAPPDVAGVVMPHDRVGALAVDQVVSLARTSQHGAPSSGSVTLVPSTWRDGRSLPASRPGQPPA